MIDRATFEQLREYDTALLANCIGYVDSTPTHEWYMGSTIRSMTPGLGPTVGVAVTCEIDTSTPNRPTTGDAGAYWRQVEQISEMDLPVVWVAKCVGSRPEHECVVGDGMAKTLYAAGCVGAVCDGGVRDVAGLLTTPFAAYGTGLTIHHCLHRVGRTNLPVEIGGIVVRPGEIIHANAEGVIKIPASAVDALLERAPAYRAFEHEAHQMLRRTDLAVADKRGRLAEMLAKHGFTGRASR